jgi:hypothetical protein
MKMNDNAYSIIGRIAIAAAGLLLCSVNSCGISATRRRNNMKYIEEGYTYDISTKIVYRESQIYGRGKTDCIYTTMVSPAGNYYKYIDGEMVEIIKDGEK